MLSRITSWFKSKPEVEPKQEHPQQEKFDGVSLTVKLRPNDKIEIEHGFGPDQTARYAELLFSLQNQGYMQYIIRSLINQHPDEAQTVCEIYDNLDSAKSGLEEMFGGIQEDYEPPIVRPTQVFPMFQPEKMND